MPNMNQFAPKMAEPWLCFKEMSSDGVAEEEGGGCQSVHLVLQFTPLLLSSQLVCGEILHIPYQRAYKI